MIVTSGRESAETGWRTALAACLVGAALLVGLEAGAKSPMLPWDQEKVTAAANRLFAEIRNLRESAAGTRENLNERELEGRRNVLAELRKMQNLASLLDTKLKAGATREQTTEAYFELRAARRSVDARSTGGRETSEIPPYLLVGLAKVDSSLAQLAAFYPQAPKK